MSLQAARERTKRSLVNDVLSGAFFSDNEICARADTLGHELRLPHAVVLVAASATDGRDTHGDLHGASPWAEAGETLAQRLRGLLPVAESEAPVPHAVAIVQMRGTNDWPELLRASHEIKTDHDVTILAVPPVVGATAIYESYVEARDLLRLTILVFRARDRVALVDDLRIYRVLQGRREDRQRFVCQTLGPVYDLNENRRRSLLQSLDAWYAAQGNIADAAHALFVHPNTLRYRLRRVEDLTGLSLRRPDQQVRLYLALQLLRLTETEATSF